MRALPLTVSAPLRAGGGRSDPTGFWREVGPSQRHMTYRQRRTLKETTKLYHHHHRHLRHQPHQRMRKPAPSKGGDPRGGFPFLTSSLFCVLFPFFCVPYWSPCGLQNRISAIRKCPKSDECWAFFFTVFVVIPTLMCGCFRSFPFFTKKKGLFMEFF